MFFPSRKPHSKRSYASLRSPKLTPTDLNDPSPSRGNEISSIMAASCSCVSSFSLVSKPRCHCANKKDNQNLICLCAQERIPMYTCVSFSLFVSKPRCQCANKKVSPMSPMFLCYKTDPSSRCLSFSSFSCVQIPMLLRDLKRKAKDYHVPMLQNETIHICVFFALLFCPNPIVAARIENKWTNDLCFPATKTNSTWSMCVCLALLKCSNHEVTAGT
jgi:hypothetical protein